MRPAITDTRLLTVLGAEVVLAIILLVWLRGRGWRLGGEIGWPSWGDALRGVGLWVATFCAGRLVMLATGALAPAIVGIAKATPLHGVLALLSVLPVALVFTAYFGRTRRLWPVVLAHVIVNAFGLSTFAGTGG